jgi:hypothetical protein
MANGTGTPPLSAAGAALGLGDLLRQDVETEADRLRRQRQQQAAGRPGLAGLGTGLGVGDSVLGPMSSFAGRLR